MGAELSKLMLWLLRYKKVLQLNIEKSAARFDCLISTAARSGVVVIQRHAFHPHLLPPSPVELLPPTFHHDAPAAAASAAVHARASDVSYCDAV